MSAFKLPTKLLEKIVEIDGRARAVAFCPNFEGGSWRYKLLAQHLLDWIPDVALRPKEIEALQHEPFKILAKSCRRLFDTEDPSARGELGEVILHAICRQEFGTAPFVARLFYKMRTNDSVTSVDSVHVFYNEEEKKLELWLGEAKLFSNVKKSRYQAYESVESLWDTEFLNEMKALIGPKVDIDAPYSEELLWIFADERSLDEIISRIVIPICISADFDPTKVATSRTADYIKEVEVELNSIRKYLEKKIPVKVKFAVVFIPMDCKEKLESEVNKVVRAIL